MDKSHSAYNIPASELTLRDVFAGIVLHPAMTKGMVVKTETAYEIADGMMKSRAIKPEIPENPKTP